MIGLTDITTDLQLGRAEVLRGSRGVLSEDRLEHHVFDRVPERRVKEGRGRRFTVRVRGRPVFSQTNIGTLSRTPLAPRHWDRRGQHPPAEQSSSSHNL